MFVCLEGELNLYPSGYLVSKQNVSFQLKISERALDIQIITYFGPNWHVMMLQMEIKHSVLSSHRRTEPPDHIFTFVSVFLLNLSARFYSFLLI